MKNGKTLCTFEYYANPQAVNNIIISWLNNHHFTCYESNGFKFVRAAKKQYFDYYFKDNKVFIDLYFGSPQKPVSLSDISNVSKAEKYGNEIAELIWKIDILSTQNGKSCSVFQLGSSTYKIDNFAESWEKQCRIYRNKYLSKAFTFLIVAVSVFIFCLINKPQTYTTSYTQNFNGIPITMYKDETDMTSYKVEIFLSLIIAITATIEFFFTSILALKAEKKNVAILLLIVGSVVLIGGVMVYILANF
ncbi:MAG: hypothetical protein IJ763_09610 [Lachnospiraceae bacterium]|nr:hypothetical protein [Lachnospiraceae bacterium]